MPFRETVCCIVTKFGLECIEIDAESRCVELPFRNVLLHHAGRVEGAHLCRRVPLHRRRNPNGRRTSSLQEVAAGHELSAHGTSPQRRNRTVRRLTPFRIEWSWLSPREPLGELDTGPHRIDDDGPFDAEP